jgi:hypothetical protein
MRPFLTAAPTPDDHQKTGGTSDRLGRGSDWSSRDEQLRAELGLVAERLEGLERNQGGGNQGRGSGAGVGAAASRAT